MDADRSAEPPSRPGVEPMLPLLAADLFRLGELPDRDLPMLAAHWLAQGHDGEALRELASLNGREREATELWPLALAEVGVQMPLAPPLAGMAWAAERVLQGERDERWLVALLWPTHDEAVDDPDLDMIVYTIDDWLDWNDVKLRSPDPAERARAQAERDALRPVLEAMARDDLPGAIRLLEEWGNR